MESGFSHAQQPQILDSSTVAVLLDGLGHKLESFDGPAYRPKTGKQGQPRAHTWKAKSI